jgi:hypothetical protein
MSNKIHLDENDKNKCSLILKKIFGSNFYFVHNSVKLEQILESEKINISTEVDKKYLPEGDKYAYCWIKFDDIPIKYNGLSGFFISPIILLNENVIFNSQWRGDPIQTEDLTNTKINHVIEDFSNVNEVFKKSFFSVYLNKNDSKSVRLKKLKKIKKYLAFFASVPKNVPLYTSRHEFLFPNGIDVKKYLIGMDMGIFDIDASLENILENKYPNVKLFGKMTSNKSEYYPKLMDICP